MVHLLKVTDIYGVEPLKDKVEDTIIKSPYISISVHNVCEILIWSKECKAPQLRNYCEQYIRSNEDLIIEQRLEYCANAEDENERSQMLELLFSVNNDIKN